MLGLGLVLYGYAFAIYPSQFRDSIEVTPFFSIALLILMVKQIESDSPK
jgi:hypothetical protein